MHLDELLLARYLDQAVSTEERLRIEAHLADCARCTKEVASTAQLLQALDGMDLPPALPPTIRQRTEQLPFRKPDRPPSAGVSRRFRTLAATLGTLLLFSVGIWFWQSGSSPTPERFRSTGSATVPALLSPADDAVLLAYPTFSWNTLSSAQSYRLRLTTAAGLPIWEAASESNTIPLSPDIALEPGQEYLWQVEALSASGSVQTSALYAFTYAPSP